LGGVQSQAGWQWRCRVKGEGWGPATVANAPIAVAILVEHTAGDNGGAVVARRPNAVSIRVSLPQTRWGVRGDAKGLHMWGQGAEGPGGDNIYGARMGWCL
jgi:hypothetical protein